ncbi:MBL fold metallo-hydrolase [Salipaludibacillus sp. CF4.18]|uniref:MBL fold metallo-hydrolase n=1 Tax=Salipaludibacillus sp. CF4.18 TaxID=3373081 RepID=UPI003EE7A38B
MKIKFLGTGLPIPNVDRVGQGILISHDGHNVLFDCGPGVNRRLFEANVSHKDINHLVFTHLHWDHFGDYDAFVQTGFVTDRETPINVYGPNGTQEVTDLLFKKVYYRDLIYRRGIRGPGAWKEPNVTEVFGGHQFTIGPFNINVFRVHHGEYVDYSLAYRIECEGKSVVISSDTAPVLGFADFAKDCDVLIHEVMAGKPPSKFLQEARPELNAEQLVNLMGHCSPRQVGEIARDTNPKKLALIHLAPNLPDDLIDQVAEYYKGSIEITEDLSEIDLEKDISALKI